MSDGGGDCGGGDCGGGDCGGGDSGGGGDCGGGDSGGGGHCDSGSTGGDGNDGGCDTSTGHTFHDSSDFNGLHATSHHPNPYNDWSSNFMEPTYGSSQSSRQKNGRHLNNRGTGSGSRNKSNSKFCACCFCTILIVGGIVALIIFLTSSRPNSAY